jgi:hypothetical protein
LGAPATAENVRFLNAWGRAEGGGGYSGTGEGMFNWLNTNRGVVPGTFWNQPSWALGVQHTVGALLHGASGQGYPDLVRALRSGKATAQQMAGYVEHSPWGTHGGIYHTLPDEPTPPFRGGAPEQGPATPGRRGKVFVSDMANLPGKPIHPWVLDFARRVAGVYGAPLTVGTGTNHREFVSGTNRQSAHFFGNAVDIPAVGQPLINMGRAALVAAGMNPRLARQQTGGLYNIGHWQIIFNTYLQQGGNHYNHMHIGWRG